MERIGFEYQVLATVKLSRAEHTLLMELSAKHYDSYCRTISKPGEQSFLYGWQWSFQSGPPDPNEVIEVSGNFRMFDTLAKITEQLAVPQTEAISQLHDKLREVLRDINAEARRLQPDDVT